jgi:hypothetical protein
MPEVAVEPATLSNTFSDGKAWMISRALADLGLRFISATSPNRRLLACLATRTTRTPALLM